MLQNIKKRVYDANLDLVAKGVVIYTWGNVSEYDRESGLDVHSGDVVEGKWKPSSDTPTHLALYKAFSCIGGITHTHSVNAVAFAQAGMNIPALGTTHADYFYGDIPCTRELSRIEVENAYEINTGKVMIETIEGLGYGPMDIPGILVKNHGPFAWGKDAAESVYHAVVMENVAEMSFKTLQLNPICTR